jgi:hypothetical protein
LDACLFPQPKHDIDPHSWPTGSSIAFGTLREEFVFEACAFGSRGLDATKEIAKGSVFTCASGSSSWGNCTISRAGSY